MRYSLEVAGVLCGSDGYRAVIYAAGRASRLLSLEIGADNDANDLVEDVIQGVAVYRATGQYLNYNERDRNVDAQIAPLDNPTRAGGTVPYFWVNPTASMTVEAGAIGGGSRHASYPLPLRWEADEAPSCNAGQMFVVWTTAVTGAVRIKAVLED